VVLEFLEA
jgi:ATP-dependent Zn protease